MPLPVGHSLMGYATYDSINQKNGHNSWRMIFLIIVVANLADIDFLPGFLVGEPNLFHRHYFSHSLGAAYIVGILLAGLFHIKKMGKFVQNFLLFFSVYFSHLVLDYFGIDRTEPFGVPIFWPFSSEYLMAPFSIFMSVEKSNNSANFFQTLFVSHNFLAVLWEFIVLIPVVTFSKLVKHRFKKQIPRRSKSQIPIDRECAECGIDNVR